MPALRRVAVTYEGLAWRGLWPAAALRVEDTGDHLAPPATARTRLKLFTRAILRVGEQQVALNLLAVGPRRARLLIVSPAADPRPVVLAKGAGLSIDFALAA